MAPRKRKHTLIPLPEGVEVGDTIWYYGRGWHIGKLEKLKGNTVGINISSVHVDPVHPEKKHLKWVGITDIKPVEKWPEGKQ